MTYMPGSDIIWAKILHLLLAVSGTRLLDMNLVDELEDTFNVLLEPDDILCYGSYENGKRIL